MEDEISTVVVDMVDEAPARHRCSPRRAMSVEKSARYLSAPPVKDRCIVVNALRNEEKVIEERVEMITSVITGGTIDAQVLVRPVCTRRSAISAETSAKCHFSHPVIDRCTAVTALRRTTVVEAGVLPQVHVTATS